MRAKILIGMTVLSVAVTSAGCAPWLGTPAQSPAGGAVETQVPEEDVVLTVDWPVFEDIAAIARQADLVVEGQFSGSREVQAEPDVAVVRDATGRDLGSKMLPATISTISVVTVLKGDATSGDTIDVIQWGGRRGDAFFRESSTVLLGDMDSDAIVLFLRMPELGPYEVLHPVQGVFRSYFDGTSTALSVEPGYQVVTLDELWQRVAAAEGSP